mmetsp:Transcript_3317/g.13933  ORF Transcript_3317/g.13933 Transcript_3317/m.13933 type:complete len:374 (-) Transcript_3317:371-1492(-)
MALERRHDLDARTAAAGVILGAPLGRRRLRRLKRRVRLLREVLQEPVPQTNDTAARAGRVRRVPVHRRVHPVRLALPARAPARLEVQIRPEPAVVARAPAADALKAHAPHVFVVPAAHPEEADVQVGDGRDVRLASLRELVQQRAPQRHLHGRSVEDGLRREVPGDFHPRQLVLHLPARDRGVVAHLLRDHLHLPHARAVRLAQDGVYGFLHRRHRERALSAAAGALLAPQRLHVQEQPQHVQEPRLAVHRVVGKRLPVLVAALRAGDDRQHVLRGLDRAERREERRRELELGDVLPQLHAPHHALRLVVQGHLRRVFDVHGHPPPRRVRRRAVDVLLARHAFLRGVQKLGDSARVHLLRPRLATQLVRYPPL